MVLNSNANSQDICEGFQCFRKAIYSIKEKLDSTGITFRLCESCASNFSINNTSSSPTETKKEKLEQQVAEPACSNILNHNQPIQQHEVLLDDII